MLRAVHFRAFLVAIALLAGAIGLSRHALAAPIKAVTFEPPLARVGSIAEVRVDLAQSYDNPFDPDLIAVDATLQGPDARTLKLPGFWTQTVARALEQGRETLSLHGEPHFALRFLPGAPGLYKLTVCAKDASGLDTAQPLTIRVAPGSSIGMVQVDPLEPMSLSVQDGTAYVPIGANVDWSGEPSGSYDIDEYYASMQAARMNWTRLWMTAFGEGWTLEWGPWHASGYYEGLGRYSLQVAGRLDHVFEQAHARGIRIQLVLWQHSQFETAQWSSWSDNPYNAAKGGPANTSSDFFTHPEALRLSRQRLRYLTARYAAFPSLFAWELMNEMEGVQAPAELVVRWCAQRAAELRSLDPYHHLLTTSYMSRPAMATLSGFASDVYDITQAHNYGGVALGSIPADATALRRFSKPLILSEYGLGHEGKSEAQDPKGYHLWEASWIALASGFNGGAMPWWWDSYLRPNDLFKTQLPLSRMLQQVDLRGLHDPLAQSFIATDGKGNQLELFGRAGSNHMLLWLRHPEARWKVATEKGMPEVAGAQVVLTAAEEALWTARFFDTFSGVLVATTTVQADERGVVAIVVPRFMGAIAIDLQAHPSRQQAVHGGCCLGHRSAGRWMWAGAMLGGWLMVWRRRERSRRLTE